MEFEENDGKIQRRVFVFFILKCIFQLRCSMFHPPKCEFLRSDYLDEFCYKFNRRYFGEALFGRLLVICVSYKNEFRYKYGWSYFTTTNLLIFITNVCYSADPILNLNCCT